MWTGEPPARRVTPGASSDITLLLIAWRAGDASAFDQLVDALYDELHRLARRCMAGERAGHTLQPTALVHEAYLRLIDAQQVNWQNRGHFLAVAARQMRRALVDIARSKGYQKRGGTAIHITFDDALPVMQEPGRDLVALDDALDLLAQMDGRKAQVVEMRFFGGLTVEQTAGALDVSVETVMRDWKFAKAWLLRELRPSESPGARA
jgi:RNA polymerase sigma factor (TIGR02999 family)